MITLDCKIYHGGDKTLTCNFSPQKEESWKGERKSSEDNEVNVGRIIKDNKG